MQYHKYQRQKLEKMNVQRISNFLNQQSRSQQELSWRQKIDKNYMVLQKSIRFFQKILHEQSSMKKIRFLDRSHLQLMIKSATHFNFQELFISCYYILIIYRAENMEIRDDFVSRTIKTEKIFSFDPGNCLYVNIEVTKKNEKSGQDSKIKISNNVCKQNDSCLIKVTEVRFGNRVIYIQDSYSFKADIHKDNQFSSKNQSAPTNSSDGSMNNNSHTSNAHNKNSFNHQKKKLIFKKKVVHENSNFRLEKRNTKNIAKNFCKAFMAYLQEQNQEPALNKMKKLILDSKYNNKVIQKMATDDAINKQFKYFLQEKAQQWIYSSKIHDKQIHIQAIKLYLQLIESGINEVQNSNEIQKQNQKSIYHSDEPYEGSEEDNMQQSHEK